MTADPLDVLLNEIADQEAELRELPGRDESIADVTLSLPDARAILAELTRLRRLVAVGDEWARNLYGTHYGFTRERRAAKGGAK